MPLPDIFGNLKKALLDVMQQQAGKLGEDFASDLKFTVIGSINFKVMDKSQKDKIILELNLPIKSEGEFKK